MNDPAPRRRLRFSLRSLILSIALITSGTGLWYRWEPWVQSALSFEGLEKFSGLNDRRDVSPDGRRAVVFESDAVLAIWDLQTNSRIYVLPYGLACDVDHVGFRRDGNEIDIVVECVGHDGEGNLSRYAMLVQFHRHRPEYWWGVAWLPEFWLTVVLGIGLGVSVWRDQRRFRKPEAKAG